MSPSWRGTRSGWCCPSSAGIAGLWLFPCFSPSRRLSAAGDPGCGCWLRFSQRVAPSPHFANYLESWTLRFFRGKYRFLKKLVLNSFESSTYAPRFRLNGFGRPSALLLVLDNDGMIWLWAQGQTSQMGLWKTTFGYLHSLDLLNPRPSEAWTGCPQVDLVRASPRHQETDVRYARIGSRSRRAS